MLPMVDIVRALVCATPHSTLKLKLLNLLGYDIAMNAYFGPSIVIRVKQLRMEPRSSIGTGSTFRDLHRVELGKNSGIGQWNWISSASPLARVGAACELKVGDRSHITSRHYIDATGGITIGSDSVIAGVRSTFITHGIDWIADQQAFKPISIGRNCILSACVFVAPGTTISDMTIVGMGAILAGKYEEEATLQTGQKATLKRAGLAGRFITRNRNSNDSPTSRFSGTFPTDGHKG